MLKLAPTELADSPTVVGVAHEQPETLELKVGKILANLRSEMAGQIDNIWHDSVFFAHYVERHLDMSNRDIADDELRPIIQAAAAMYKAHYVFDEEDDD